MAQKDWSESLRKKFFFAKQIKMPRSERRERVSGELKRILRYYFAASWTGEGDSFGHSQYVVSYTVLLAKAVGIEDLHSLAHIERGALLHDVGKLFIPDSILQKPTPLTLMEKTIIREHPLMGYKMLKGFNFFSTATRIVLYHHEHYDGRGYPFGLAGEEIPLEARIFALADTLDAITSDRPYRRGKTFKEALSEIEQGYGSQFDPQIVDVFLSIPEEVWWEVRTRTFTSLRLLTIH